MHEALERAIGILGGQTRAARALGVSQPSVWNWLRNMKKAPPEKVLAIEAATGVSRHDLRPDLYPPTKAKKRKAA